MNKHLQYHTLYLFMHLPKVWNWKVGVTGKNATKRAKQVDRAVRGKPLKVFAVFLPFFAYSLEQWIHRRYKNLNNRFYKGDGSTEWFLIPVAVPVFLIMLIITLIQGGLLCYTAGRLLNFDGLEWYICFLQVLWGWIVDAYNFIF